MNQSEDRLARWQDRTEGPGLLLAIVYLGAWSVLVLARHLPEAWVAVFVVLIAVIWILFAVDYVIKVSLARHRGRYVGTHLPDLLAVILPFLRPVVQLTHIHSVPYFRKRTGAAQRTRIIVLAVSFAIVFIYSMSLAVYAAERDAPGSLITDFGDALWWACVTIFTVGYGDMYPVTALGRGYAVMLMLGGVGIIGTASAIVVSYLNERIHPPKADADEAPDFNQADL